MDVLLYHDFLNEYFLSSRKYYKSPEETLRHNIIHNPKNRVVMSINYGWYLEQLFNSNHGCHNQYCDFIVELMDDPTRHVSLGALTSPTAVRIEDEFCFIASAISSNLFIPITEIPLPTLPTTVSIASRIKPNRDWQLSEFAANSSIRVKYHDFTADAEINNFFLNLFNLPNTINQLYYFDSYAKNVLIHSHFNVLTTKAIPCEVYTFGKRTRYVDLSLLELQTLKGSIISVLGTLCRVFYTLDNKLIHERKVMFNGIIIDSTHDFAELLISNKTWIVDVSYSQADINAWLPKTVHFTEII